MSYETQTWVAQEDGLSSLFSSRYPNGDRNYPSTGSDALRFFEIEAGHGGMFAVKSDGTYAFGSRSVPHSQHFMLGDRLWLNGVETVANESALNDGDATDDASSAFRLSDGFAARGEKSGRGDFAFESRSDNQWIGSPYPVAAASTPDARTTGKIIFSYKMRHMGTLESMRLSYYGAATTPENFVVSDTGTFEYGETFTGVKSGGGAFTGKIIAVNTVNSSIMFIPDGSYNSTDNFNGVGAVIVGDVSGASATMIAAGYTIPLANKPIRASTNNSAFPSSLPTIGLDFITTSGAQFAHKLREYPDVLDDQRPQATINQSGNQWEDWEYQIDYSGSTFKTKTYRNGQVYEYTHTNENDFDLENITTQIGIIQFAYDWGGSTNPSLIRARVKNTLLDYDLAGVSIGDAPVLSDCTELNRCGVLNWGENTAYCVMNYGEIPTGENCYLFVRNDEGVYINPTAGLNIGVAE